MTQRLLITADIHGSYRAWTNLNRLLEPEDSLVIAGDLFDTRYGNDASPDFQPGVIKQEIQSLAQRVYYVYGNCDIPEFFPGHRPFLEFNAWDKKIFLSHGHYQEDFPQESRIIIQGHTHICQLEKKEGRIYMNPGSLKNPRNQWHTYGIIDPFQARIMDFTTNDPLITLDL